MGLFEQSITNSTLWGMKRHLSCRPVQDDRLHTHFIPLVTAMPPPRELHTARLWLRPPRPGDAEFAHARWDARADVLRYLDWHPATTLAQTRARLDWDAARWQKHSAWTWLMLLHDPRDDAAPEWKALAGPIGLISLTPQRLDGPSHHLRLGYLLAPEVRRHGLMREAVAAVCAAAWQDAVVQRLDALCDADNLPSLRLLEQLGWQREGLLRRHSLHPNVSDQARDVWICAAPWPASRDAAPGG